MTNNQTAFEKMANAACLELRGRTLDDFMATSPVSAQQEVRRMKAAFAVVEAEMLSDEIIKDFTQYMVTYAAKIPDMSARDLVMVSTKAQLARMKGE